LALIPFTVAIKSHAQFCIQDSNQCNKLECSPGVQKEGQFPALHHQKKKPPPNNSSDLSFLQAKIFFLAHQSEIFKFFFKPRKLSFNSFFLVVGTWVCGGGGEGFVVVTSFLLQQESSVLGF
jgi:hypothetical protein